MTLDELKAEISAGGIDTPAASWMGCCRSVAPYNR